MIDLDNNFSFNFGGISYSKNALQQIENQQSFYVFKFDLNKVGDSKIAY